MKSTKNNVEKKSSQECEECLFMGVQNNLEAQYACMGCTMHGEEYLGWKWQPKGAALIKRER